MVAVRILLFWLALGSTVWWTPVLAQGFNKRYDPIVPGNAQFAWGLELLDNGNILVVHNQLPWIDSLFYNSRTGSLVVNGTSGASLSDEILHTPLVDAFPGWSNPTDKLPDGSFIGGGATTDTTDLHRILLYRFDANGNPSGYIEIQPSPSDWIAYQCKRDRDGGIVFTGVTDATGFQDIFLLKTDSVGNVQWWQTYGHPTRADYSASVDLSAGGGYYIGGAYPHSASTFVRWVVATDSLGLLLWQELRGPAIGSNGATNAAVLSLADGNLVYASGKPSGVIFNLWPELVKLDAQGNELWAKTYGFDQFGSAFLVVQEVTPFGDLIACGQRFFQGGIFGSYSMGTLLRTTANGDSIWMRDYFYYDSLMTDGEGTLRDVQPTPDGGFVAVGAAFGSITGNNPPGLSQDVWVVKVDSMGCIEPGCHIITGITTQVTNLKDALSVWPNPTRDRATVKVTLPQGGSFQDELRLHMVSTQGQEVLAIPVVPGENVLDVGRLASGLYYLHLTNGNTWLSGTKLIVE